MAKMSFLRRATGLSLKDRLSKLGYPGEASVELLLLRIERSQLGWFKHIHLGGDG